MNKQTSNIPRFILVGILTIAIVIMWVNNKNKAEEISKRTEIKVEIPSAK